MARNGRAPAIIRSHFHPISRIGSIPVLLCGIAAMLLASFAGVFGASAQSAYGVGGYLERPGENDFADRTIGASSSTVPIGVEKKDAEGSGEQRSQQARRKRPAARTEARRRNADEDRPLRRLRRQVRRTAPEAQEKPAPRRAARTRTAPEKKTNKPSPPVPEHREAESTAPDGQSAGGQSDQSYTPAASADGEVSADERKAESKPDAAAKTAPADTTAAIGGTAAKDTPTKEEEPAPTESRKPETETAARAESQDGLGRMTGQMLVVGFRGLAPSDPGTQKLAAQIKSGLVGGVVFMSHNVKSPEQVATLAGSLKSAAGVTPVLIAVDKEGSLTHGKGFKEFPSAAQVGKSISPLDAYTLYKSMAAELAESGFNLNLGPVLDLRVEGGDNPRSFGSEPKAVASFGKAFVVAHHDAGVLTVLRHFPGAGAERSWDKAALEPYRQLIGSGNADAVMTGHAAGAAFSDTPDLPASLSKKAVTTMLRGDLKFAGVAVSDDLEAGGTALSLEERAVQAIQAGNDLLIIGNHKGTVPDLPEKMVAAIRKAVESGAISRERIEASHDRIMALKQKLSAAASQALASAGRDGKK